MSISISSGNILDSLYNNNNGQTSFYTGSYTRTQNVVDEEKENSVALSKDLKRTLRNLEDIDYDDGISTDSLNYVRKLVGGYNDLIDSRGNRSYSRKVKEMKELFEDNKKELEKIGVTLENGEAYFDAENFLKADPSDFKELFSSDSSFLKETNRLVRSMNNSIKDEVVYTLNDSVTVNNTVNSKNIKIADDVNSVIMSLNELMNNNLADDGSNANQISELLNKYGEDENAFWNTLSNNLDADLSSKAIDCINKIITLNDELNNSTDDFNSLFENNGTSYGSKITSLYKDLFGELVGAGNNFEISNFVDYSV